MTASVNGNDDDDDGNCGDGDFFFNLVHIIQTYDRNDA